MQRIRTLQMLRSIWEKRVTKMKEPCQKEKKKERVQWWYALLENIKAKDTICMSLIFILHLISFFENP